MTRAELEQTVQTALARVAYSSAQGVLSLASINRARRDIMHAADAYRAWLPDADPPTETQRFLQREHRRVLQATVYAIRPNRDERPSP